MESDLDRVAKSELVVVFDEKVVGMDVEFDLINTENGAKTTVRRKILKTKEYPNKPYVTIEQDHLKRIRATKDATLKIGKVVFIKREYHDST